MSFAIKLPIKGVLGNVLRSRATGWGFFALLAIITGLWIKYDNMADALAKCEASKPSAATLEFAEELKDIDREKLKQKLDALDAADHPCLDWVFDPKSEDESGDLQDTGEAE